MPLGKQWLNYHLDLDSSTSMNLYYSGYPIVYNISLAIPFIAVPALGILISYLATVAGLHEPSICGQVPWTTPVFLNAWLATAGDFRAILVQLVIFALGVLLYIPFIKVNDKVVEQEMKG